MELAIRDLKDQALAHFPSGQFLANAAWTVIAALAHNLLRWTTLIGLPDTIIPTARTLRRRLLTVPGRITRTARTVTLRMPARWPWEHEFLTALERLRAVPATHLTARRPLTRTIGAGPRPRPARSRRRDGLNWPHPHQKATPPGPNPPRRPPTTTPTTDQAPATPTSRSRTVDRGLVGVGRGAVAVALVGVVAVRSCSIADASSSQPWKGRAGCCSLDICPAIGSESSSTSISTARGGIGGDDRRGARVFASVTGPEISLLTPRSLVPRPML